MLLLSTLLLVLVPSAMAFDFSVVTTNLQQCGAMDITWNGGSPPFNLIVIGAFDYPTNLTIPDNAYSNGQGSYTWQVNYPADTELVMMMGDSTGIGTGGVSSVYRVGSGAGDCTLRSTQADFQFELDQTTVTQCRPVTVAWSAEAIGAVRIIGVIPHGQVFEITSGDNSDQRVWSANIAAGSQFLLAAFDEGPYGNGGTSQIYTMGASSDSSCLNDLSPSSTPAAPSSTGTQTGTRTGTATRTGGGNGIKTVTAITTVTPSDSGGVSKGTVAGIAAGSVIGGIVVAALIVLLWFRCGPKSKRGYLGGGRQELSDQHKVKRGDIDLANSLHGANGVLVPDPNEAIHALSARRNSRGSHFRLGRARTVTDENEYQDNSTISPFWDENRASQSQYTLDVDLGAPLTAYSSQGGNSFPASPDSPNEYSASSPLVPPFTQSQSRSTFPSSSSHLHHSGSSSIGNMSKAQLASSFVANNPDRHRHLEDPSGHGATPPMDAPLGGFVRERDAGRVSHEGTPEAEHLPPMYDPQWQTQNPKQSPP